jgi:hypothetical protein
MSNGTSTPPATTAVQNPLTLLLPIRNAEVYSLRSNLQALQVALKAGLDAVGIVHFARLVILPNTNILAVITEFDGDFNDYILAFVRSSGVAQVFDTILSKVDDVDTPPSVPPGTALVPVTQNTDGFIQYLDYYNCTSASRSDSFAWYSAYPSLTVKQILGKPGT